MVGLNDEHDHGDGPVCPGCRFREALAEQLEWAAAADETSWHEFTGELIVLMGTVLSTLTALRAAHVEDEDVPDTTAATAAAAIARLGGVIDGMWHVLLDDDQDDDPSVGL